jgi:tRNA threonylcarbamoyladenosine biosynthesis protein TsaE
MTIEESEGVAQTRNLRNSRILHTVEDTEAFGRELAAGLRAGDLVILDGPLGAGKTALTRGIAAGLGVRGRVSSPTFVIAREHRAGHREGAPEVGLVHVDAYRLSVDGSSATDVIGQLDALDLDTDLEDAVVVVEWGTGLVEHLVDRHLRVVLHRRPESDTRSVEWSWIG